MEAATTVPEDFWVETARNSPAGLVAVLVALVIVCFVLVKYGLPLIKELRMKRLDNERYKIETADRAAQAREQIDHANNETQQRQLALQEQSNRILESVATELAAVHAGLDDSKLRSHEMGGHVLTIKEQQEAMQVGITAIRETQVHMAEQIDDIYDATRRRTVE